MTDITQNNDQKSPAKHRKIDLLGHHYRAVELRYEGKSFREISFILGLEFKKAPDQETIRLWFTRTGLLHKEYLAYARAENDQRRQLMREELKKLVVKIPGKLAAIMERVDATEKPDMTALMGIKTIIEVLGITAGDEKESTDVLKEYFERLEEAPAPKTMQRV
jgi:hypothetical protein